MSGLCKRGCCSTFFGGKSGISSILVEIKCNLGCIANNCSVM